MSINYGTFAPAVSKNLGAFTGCVVRQNVPLGPLSGAGMGCGQMKGLLHNLFRTHQSTSYFDLNLIFPMP